MLYSYIDNDNNNIPNKKISENICDILDKLELLRKAKACFGICSNTKDNKHILFIDFDKIKYGSVISTLKSIQINYNISTFYVLKTTNGYNAFSLSKRSISEIEEIYNHYDNIDKLYIKLSIKKRGFFVLRMDNNKKIVGMVENHNDDILSFAHYRFFTDVMSYHLFDFDSFDNFLWFKIISYKSVKSGFVDIDFIDKV